MFGFAAIKLNPMIEDYESKPKMGTRGWNEYHIHQTKRLV